MGRLVVTSSVADVVALLPAGVTVATHLLQVGGGGGGGRAGSSGGGGGAGEIIYRTNVTLSGTMPVTIGAGGVGATATGAGGDGGGTVFDGQTAAGGGGGAGGSSGPAGTGACGGGGSGAAATELGAPGTVGGDGGDGVASGTGRFCGGGGGMGGNGETGVVSTRGGNGGTGVDYSAIFGSDVGSAGWFAGGGGGGTRLSGSTGGAGQAGGGNGGSSNQNATAAAANTGSGGGGSGSTTGGSNVGNGGNGATGVLILMYDDPPDDPTIPTVVSGASAGSLTNPSSPLRAGIGKGQHWQWYNLDAGRWDAILPTSSGWAFFTDMLGSPVAGTIVDNRQATRIDTLWDEAGASLWVLRGHTSTPRITRYDWTGSGYVADSGITDITVTGVSASDLDASPLLLHRTPNGRLWAVVGNGSQVVVSISDDDGASWSSANVITGMSQTAAVGITDVDGLLVIVVEQNDGGGRTVRTIDQSASSISSGNWATETLPSLSSPLTSDDHGMIAAHDGRIYGTGKTSGSTGSGQTLLYLLERDPAGTWSQHQLRPGPDNQGDTRPVLVAHGDTLYVGYGRNQTPTDGMRVTVPRSTLTPDTPGVLLDADDGRWSDSYAVPRDVSALSGLLWLAHDTDTGDVWRVWEPLPGYGDSSIGVSLGIAATAVKRGAVAAPMSLALATSDAGDKTGQGAMDVGVDVTATGAGAKTVAGAAGLGLDVSPEAAAAKVGTTAGGLGVGVDFDGAATKTGTSASDFDVDLAASGDATKTGTGAASLGIDVTAEGAATKHAVATATLELALAIAAATQLGVTSELGLGLGIAATATKHTSVGAGFGLGLSTGELATKAGNADTQLAVALEFLATAARVDGAVAELGLDLAATAAAAKHAAAYATLTLGLTVETVAAKQAIADAAFNLAIAVSAETGDPTERDITILSAEIVPSPWRGELVPSAWSAEVVA